MALQQKLGFAGIREAGKRRQRDDGLTGIRGSQIANDSSAETLRD